MRPFPLFLAFAPVLTGLLAAQQDPADDPFGHSRHGAEFNEGPRQAAYLMQGMSPQVHFAITTKVPLAQQFFDQGICQQHGFWYFESERSFRQAALLDPDCAIAYFGMCLSNVENVKRSSGFIAQAVQREAQASARESMWIDAWAKYHQIDAALRADLQSGDAEKIKAANAAVVKKNEQRDNKVLGRDLVRGLEAIVAAYPDDVEAKAFLALQIWRNTEFGLELSSHGAVDAILDQVFAAAPMHPAHHFRIHLWDHENAVRALHSAAVLGHTAPAIAHNWHMSGHIFEKLDRHADAAWQQEAAARVDHAFMMRDRVMPYDIHNYGHNSEWLSRSLSDIGRVHDAVDLVKNMTELPRHPQKNKVVDGGSIAGYGRTRLLEHLTTYELWNELVACCAGPWLEPTTDRPEQVRRLLALGRAQFRLGNVAAGKQVIVELEEQLAALRVDRAKAVDQAEDAALAKKESNDKVREAMAQVTKDQSEPLAHVRAAVHELRGEQLLAAQDAKAALAEFELAPGTPRVTLADAHQKAGDAAKAVSLLEEEVSSKKAQVPPLARLVQALHAAGRKDEAKARFAELRTLGGAADLDAPLLQPLGAIAQEFGWPADWREPKPPAADSGAAERPPLDSLGPFRWSPVAAPLLDVPLAGGGRLDLQARHGKPTLLVFYLGFGCVHCVEQLQAFAPRARDFTAAGIDIVAIGTEPLLKVEGLLATQAPDKRIPFPLACDPELFGFKAYRAYDDFEHMALHSTVLIDGQGRIRWQDISYEPFTEVDWLLAECQRLLAIPPLDAGTK